MSETKISLKLLIDSKANKVLFAEAGKEFVDFLFTILSLPIGTVVKLLNENGMMVTSIGSIYKSVESLSSEYFQEHVDKDDVLQPKAVVYVPLLELDQGPDINLEGYVKEVVTYMVMDNLEVKPMSTISGISLLNMFNVKDVSVLIEKQVQVGFTEALAILKASLEVTNSALTTVFLIKEEV